MYDNLLIRDKNGAIRIDENMRFTDEQAKEIIETIFVKTGKIVGLKQLDITLREYDGPITGRQRGPGKKWTREDRAHVLNNYKLDNATIGAPLGRSFMSIKHAKADLLTDFDEWCEENPTKIVGLTREQCVSLFLDEED